MIFPQIEETRIAIEDIPIPQRDVATQCFLDLLSWFRIIIIQDGVFLRKHFPSLNLWRQPPFSQPIFEEFSIKLLHEASFGEDPKYIQIAKAMPKMAHLMQDHQQNILSTLSTHHRSSEAHRNEIQAQLGTCTDVLKPLSLFVHHLSLGGVQMRTQITLDDANITPMISPQAPSNPSNPVGLLTASASTRHNHSQDFITQYQLNANVTTIPILWEEYDRGIISTQGEARGPSIPGLDDQFGVKWRRVDTYRKQYARRRHIWEAILRVSKNLEVAPEIAAEKMERWRYNNRYTLNKVNSLLSAIAPGTPGLWGDRDVGLRHVV